MSGSVSKNKDRTRRKQQTVVKVKLLFQSNYFRGQNVVTFKLFLKVILLVSPKCWKGQTIVKVKVNLLLRSTCCIGRAHTPACAQGNKGIAAEVKQSIISDICDDLHKITRSSLVSRKSLHSLAGKPNHAAGLLIVMRNYLEPMGRPL